MSSSSFAPLAEAVPRVFRPFGAPPAGAAAEPAPAPGPSAEEIERAFGAGVERGRAEARAALETIGASFTDSLRELAEFRARLKERYERELLELALGVARKVVQQELAEDPSLPAGGCVVESRFGEVDIGIETQLERCERALVSAVE